MRYRASTSVLKTTYRSQCKSTFIHIVQAKMIRTVKPKNARAKRAMDKKEPKLVENVKQASFVHPGPDV